MPIIGIVITLAVIGLIMWAIDQIPMDGTIKRIIHVVIIVLVCLWLLQIFGVWGGLGSYRVGPITR